MRRAWETPSSIFQDCSYSFASAPLVLREVGGNIHRLKRLAGQPVMFQRGARTQAHLARQHLFFAAWAGKRRLDRATAIAMDQFDRRARAARHPAIAPGVQHDDEGKRSMPFSVSRYSNRR